MYLYFLLTKQVLKSGFLSGNYRPRSLLEARL